MANKKTLALTLEQFQDIITHIQTGFINNGKIFKPNGRLAAILTIEANLGIRIGDVLNLRITSFIKDGVRYRLDIIEEKTGKARTFTVPVQIYNYIKMYALENDKMKGCKLFDISLRSVNKQLKIVCDYLGYKGIGTHSFRKYFATQIYINNNYNIQLVSQLLQHSSTAITQKYIGIQQKEIEDALNKHIHLI